MAEFFEKITSLNYWEVTGDLHGFFSMLALILFGAAIVLTIQLKYNKEILGWLKKVMGFLFATVVLLESSGLFIYRPYRTKAVPSPRTFLKSSESTSWLHSTIFEHKEHLAYGPLIIIIVAFVLVCTQGERLQKRPGLRKAVIFSLVISLVYVLIVAAEAVLVTKAAPLGGI